MKHPITVAIDADGNCDDYLILIVTAETGVTYVHQCGGFACLQNSAEGFLVQVGTSDDRERLYDWFQSEFEGSCMNSSVWTPDRTAMLESLISHIACGHVNSDGVDFRHMLQLDRERMQECVEAWIPVLSPYGPGLVVLNNSD
ncbi:MAG: hypothetical protein EOP86_02800 [Verrucomicrobiaceae bacterium]|nr:MAG: hypothetical protein EOP86_02800 [Verrucomicrobiaceae bacterium]